MNEEYTIKHFDVNFTECRYIGELYRELKKKLELPDWCGENLDALWDALTGIMYTPADISVTKKQHGKIFKNMPILSLQLCKKQKQNTEKLQ